MMQALPFLNHFAELSRLSSAALIAAIWQGTLLAGIAALALRLAPRIPAAARFVIWFAVFTLVAALPFLNSFSPATAITSSAPAHTAWLQLDSRFTLIIAALWVVASLFRAATLIAAAFRVRTLARNATPIAHEFVSAPRRAQLCSSIDIDRPTVIGFFAPRILIPAWLIEKLTFAEIDHIVLHESGHLNRADDWLNLLQKLALVLFPLNPALAWVERRLCFERELACDERVLAALASVAAKSESASTSYASSLTTLAEYRLQHRGLARNLALALGALGASVSTSELGRRVARILHPAARMRPLHVRLATASAIAALLFTTTELEHSPQLISFTSPASVTQLASAAPQLLPGYHAVAARISLPAAAQMKPVGDAAPRLALAYSRNITPSASGSRRDIAVRAVIPTSSTRQRAALHLTAARQSQPQSDFVITRYTIFQPSDGTRIVRTSAVFTSEPAPPSMTDSDTSSRPNSVGADTSSDSGAPHTSRLRRQSISQDISPYAAVPVPGGWLVFRL